MRGRPHDNKRTRGRPRRSAFPRDGILERSSERCYAAWGSVSADSLFRTNGYLACNEMISLDLIGKHKKERWFGGARVMVAEIARYTCHQPYGGTACSLIGATCPHSWHVNAFL